MVKLNTAEHYVSNYLTIKLKYFCFKILDIPLLNGKRVTFPQ